MSIAAAALRARRSRELQGRFGPEYDRVAADAPSKRQAEAELKARAERHDEFDLSPLDPRDRDTYRARWQDVQAKFVDDPDGAVQDADGLIQDVMRRRGYPVDDFDTRAADLSVDHPDVVENYRAGHGIAVARERGKAGTDELRRAIQHYRVAVRRARRADRAGGGAVMTEERIQTGDLVTDDADAPIARDERASEGRERLEPLFDPAREQELRDRWHALQAQFVDEPRDTVSEADSLVAELLARSGAELRRRAIEARGAVVERRRRLDRRPAGDPAAVPLVLRAAPRGVLPGCCGIEQRRRERKARGGRCHRRLRERRRRGRRTDRREQEDVAERAAPQRQRCDDDHGGGAERAGGDREHARQDVQVILRAGDVAAAERPVDTQRRA